MASSTRIIVAAAGGIVLLLLMAFVTLAVLTPPGSSVAGQKDFSFRTHPADGQGFSLSVVNVNGGVDISSWGGSDVLLNGSITATGFGAEPSDVGLVPTTSGTQLSLVVQPPADAFLFGRQYSVPIHVFVPEGLRFSSVHLESVNGILNLSDSIQSQSIQLTTTNGEILFHGLSGGSVSVTTTNGAISGRLDAVAQGANLVFTSTNGGISIHVPSQSSFSLTISNVNGEISTSGINLTSVNQQGQHQLSATVGNPSGTGKVSLTSVNGDIAVTGF